MIKEDDNEGRTPMTDIEMSALDIVLYQNKHPYKKDEYSLDDRFAAIETARIEVSKLRALAALVQNPNGTDGRLIRALEAELEVAMECWETKIFITWRHDRNKRALFDARRIIEAHDGKDNDD